MALFNAPAILANFERAVSLFHTLGGDSRLRIVCYLAGGEMRVGDIAIAVRQRETAVSQQLAILLKAGIVSVRKDGQSRYYKIASGDTAAVLDALAAGIS